MPDVNVLVYAHRAEARAHPAYRAWLERVVNGKEPFALSTLVAVAFARIVTSAKLFSPPTPLAVALATVEQLVHHPRCRVIVPREDHWHRVAGLCRATGATGKLVADAAHAAVAMSAGCTWVTRDSDFSKFAAEGLRWQHLVL